MKKIELITFIGMSSVLIALAIGLYFFSSHFPKMFDVEKAQQVYEDSVINPKPFSAEERTALIETMVEVNQAGERAMSDLFGAARIIANLLLLMSAGIIIQAIRVYMRDNSAVSSPLKSDVAD